MKIHMINCSPFIACILFLSSGSAVYAGTMGAESTRYPSQIYLGVFGGGGAITNGNLSQEGTAFYSDSNGGPLAVNAKGEAISSSAWVVGGHLGYKWPARLLNHLNSNWTISPATELEAYYLGGSTLQGDDLNNGTTRLVEHYFRVTYPMQTGVALVNVIYHLNHTDFGTIHPYLGVGAGTAVISIAGANSTQKTPSEPDINHYNSGSSDTSTAFAAQPKIGVSFDLSQNTTMFVEYRFLYLSATNFTFGSTVYPTHVATSNWDVKLGSQYYNIGTMGIQYDL